MTTAGRDEFLEGMSNAACTVNIVTTDGVAGRAGLTVSAMSSVSADPPSLLVCVHHESSTSERIKENGVFCVNVLQDCQAFISDSFASPVSSEERFACADWQHLTTGAPVLSGALVAFDCNLKKSFQWGSHFIFIGQVSDIAHAESGNPLIYANRAYGKAVKIDPKLFTHTAGEGVGSHIRFGCFTTASPFFVPRLLSAYRLAGHEDEVQLVEAMQSELMRAIADAELDLALIYDLEPFQLKGLETELVAEVAPQVILPQAHPLAHRSAISLKELVPSPMIAMSAAYASQDYINRIFESVDSEAQIAYRAPSFEVMRGMVANGLGYAISITKPASNMSYDGRALAVLPIEEKVPKARLVLAHRGRARMQPPVQQFADFCRGFFLGKDQ